MAMSGLSRIADIQRGSGDVRQVPKFGSDAFNRSAPCHLLRLFKMPSSLPKALLTDFRRPCRCLEIPRLKAGVLLAGPSRPLKKFANIFVSGAACEATQSFEKDGANAGLLRTCALNYGAAQQQIPIS
jgi:hypothetical protein